MIKKIIVLIMTLIIIFDYSSPLNLKEFKTYRVVIDPGHGGIRMPMDLSGDRFDPESKTFIRNFNYGASVEGYDERQIMYQISCRVMRILSMTEQDGDFDSFLKIASRFTRKKVPRVFIEAKQIRERSISRDEACGVNDPNGKYRLFDYESSEGVLLSGRISEINNYNPHLVVSLHCDGKMPPESLGMCTVIAPPYSFMLKALDYLNTTNDAEKKKISDFFDKSPFSGWIVEDFERTKFDWFLSDAMLYFKGLPLTKEKNINLQKYQNPSSDLVTWFYKNSTTKSPSDIIKTYNQVPFSQPDKDNLYWSREASAYESFRRDGGSEGFGGDNCYASTEIIRYVLTSLRINNDDAPVQKVGKPYVSIWAIPLYVNAVSAYVELGCLSNERLRYLLLNRQQYIAEGIAVGIYSLLAGLEVDADNYIYRPKGEKIDYQKYLLPDGRDYFEFASEVRK